MDLSFLNKQSKGLSRAKGIQSALRTQILGRFAHAAEPSVLCGVELHGEKNQTHLVGAVAQHAGIKRNYEEWRRGRGIINPHIGSNAAALANLYLALYPAAQRQQNPHRVVVLETRDTAYAILMDDWRLLNSIQWQMMQGQQLDAVLVDGWMQYFKERHEVKDTSSVCVIRSHQASAAATFYVEVWNPFERTAPWTADAATCGLIETYPDLAALAFGMALQGG